MKINMKSQLIILLFIVCLSVVCISGADRLPREVPENQIFSVDTQIKASGIISEESEVQWNLDYQHLYANGEYNYGNLHDGKLNRTESISIMEWEDALRSSGGSIALSKKFGYNSRNKVEGRFNLQNEKVLTYRTKDGAHLMGRESWNLDVAGNYDSDRDYIRCVFSNNDRDYFPAFCNVVKAESNLVNFNNGQVSTKGASRSVSSQSQYPATLNYIIAVSPDSGLNIPAMGTIKTMFGGSIMEAREQSNNVSATNNWKDTLSVTGGIERFQKKLMYDSGLKI